MLCDQCHQREATNHICSVVDGVTRTQDLCTECLQASGAPETAFAASMRGARCDFCGAPANLGGTDYLPLPGEQQFHRFCSTCWKEFNRFVLSVMKEMPVRLSEEQQIEKIRQLRQDVDAHMKEWVSRKPQ